MSEKFEFPKVTIRNKVVSSDYHCADAVLVEVEDGTGALSVEAMINGYEIKLNGENLFSVNEDEYCPTCGGNIYRGYGERNVSMEEAMAFSGRINGPYEGIRKAVGRIHPLLGLLKPGCYVVADYELHPFPDNQYFWNYLGLPELFAAWGERMGLENYAIHTCPAHLIPSQRPAKCNPQQLEHYIRQVGSEDYPRAIGLYISGNTVLLLDGHHKAAAAASKGKPVKCLVIMPAELSEDAAGKIGSGTLLHHGKYLLDDTGALAGWVSPCLSRYAKYDDERSVPAGGNFENWGSVPEEYIPDIKLFSDTVHQEMMEFIYYGKENSYALARETMQGWFTPITGKNQTLLWLRWHQAQFNALSGGAATPWQMPLLRRNQWNELNRMARNYGIDRDAKTANAVYGVFSFLPGQISIRDIPFVLEEKQKTEAIHTVLIPKSVREVDVRVFDNFPELENIVLEKGNPKLRPQTFRAIADRIRQKREKEREDDLHLKHYPFAGLDRMLREKQEKQ